MMKLIHGINSLAELDAPLHLALGVFDGVHVGHQAVMTSAVDSASKSNGLAGVLTFEPHPIRVVAPSRAPRRILASIDHKAELLGELGIDLLCVEEFTLELATVPAEQFIRELFQSCENLRSISVGEDWMFGKDRGGDVTKLRQWGKELGFEVHAIPAVKLDGSRISSTMIRESVRVGDMESARRMLGRNYDVVGTVVTGKQLARTLGFPTANTVVHNEQLPPDGVWALEVTLLDPRWSGQVFRGIGNLGRRPTVEDPGASRLLEVHLFDFTGDLYGLDLEATFIRYIRKEVKFSGIEALKKQIAQDVAQVKADFT